ncbi:MAG: peptidylprolyl isomerase [Bacillota bacterium]
MKKRIILFILVIVMTLSLMGCGSSKTESTWEGGNPIVTIEMEDGGIIELELYPQIAPITVENFCSLADSGFYDGLTFHRVISGFMIQGGDPLGTGMGGSDDKIVGEFSANGYENTISHTRGVISMARSSSYDSASSQFFIMHADSAYLDGAYAAFGEVISGMDVVDEIAAAETIATTSGESSSPAQPIIIKSITVEYTD